MEMYKIKFYNPERDFEPYDVDTAVSKELMDEIKRLLLDFKTPNLELTPIMVDPTDMSLRIGVIEKENNILTKRYEITIASAIKAENK